MQITEFRTQNPDYNDMDDIQLAQALHAKNYSDIPFPQFAQRFGVALPVPANTWDYVAAQGGSLREAIPHPMRGAYDEALAPLEGDRQEFEDKLAASLFFSAVTGASESFTFNAEEELSRQLFGKVLKPSEITAWALENEDSMARQVWAWNKIFRAREEQARVGPYWEDVFEKRLDAGMANVLSGFTGTLGQLNEQPGYGRWAPPLSRENAERMVAKHKANSRLYYEAAQHPDLVMKRDDAMAKLFGMVAETVPYITATTAASFAAGPLGAFMVGYSVEGESAYQNARAGGAPEELALKIKAGVGIAAAAIEMSGALGAEKLLSAVTEKIVSKGIKRGAQFGFGSISEALEEGLQEGAALGGESTYKDIDADEAVRRVLLAAGGGAAVGGTFNMGRHMMNQAMAGAENEGQWRNQQRYESAKRKMEDELSAKARTYSDEVAAMEALADDLDRAQEEAAAETGGKEAAETGAEGATAGVAETEAAVQPEMQPEAESAPEVTGETADAVQSIEGARRQTAPSWMEAAVSRETFQAWLKGDIGAEAVVKESLKFRKEPTTAGGYELDAVTIREEGAGRVAEIPAMGRQLDVPGSHSEAYERAIAEGIEEVENAELGADAALAAGQALGQEGIIAGVTEDKGVGREQQPPNPERPGGTKAFAEQVTELKAQHARGEISTEDLGRRIMSLQTPDEQHAEPATPIKSLVERYDDGDLNVGGIVAELEAEEDLDSVLQSLIDEYKDALAADRYEYGMRSGLPETAEDKLIAGLRSFNPSTGQAAPGSQSVATEKPQETADEGAAEPPNTQEVLDAEQSPRERLSSPQKRFIAKNRDRLGLAAINSKSRRTWEQAMARAWQEKVPENALRIATEINLNPFPLADYQSAGLTIRMVELENEHESVMASLHSEKDPVAVKEMSARANTIEAEVDNISRALDHSDSEIGRALNALKLTINQNFSLVAVKTRAKAAKGAELSKEEAEKFAKLTTELAEKSEQVEQMQKELAKAKAAKATGRGKKGGRKRASVSELRSKRAQLVNRVAELMKAGCYDA